MRFSLLEGPPEVAGRESHFGSLFDSISGSSRVPFWAPVRVPARGRFLSKTLGKHSVSGFWGLPKELHFGILLGTVLRSFRYPFGAPFGWQRQN